MTCKHDPNGQKKKKKKLETHVQQDQLPRLFYHIIHETLKKNYIFGPACFSFFIFLKK